MSTSHRQVIGFTVEPGIKAALQLWAEADHRSLSRQIEFLVVRALFRRGIDPCDFYRGAVIPSAGEPMNMAEYLELAAKRRAVRRQPGAPPEPPSDGRPTADGPPAGS